MPSLKKDERRRGHVAVDESDGSEEEEEYDDEDIENDGDYDTSRMPLRARTGHRRPMSGHSTRSRSLSRTGSRLSMTDPLVSGE